MEQELFKKAREAFENGNYDEAIQLMERLYVDQRTFHNNYFLFKVLKKDQQWERAVKVANEFLKEYIQNNDYFYQYFDCMLHSGDVLGSFKLYLNLKKYLNLEEEQNLQTKLKLYPSYLTKEQQQTKQETLRKLKYLGGYTINEQRQILSNLKFLNPQELFLNCKSALIDQNVPCIVRMSLLDMVRTVSSVKVEVLDIFEKKITVDLSNLKKLEDTDIFQRIKNEIFDSKKISEPLKLRIFSEAKVKLLVIYPEIENYNYDVLQKIIFSNLNDLDGNLYDLRTRIDKEINKINDFKIY